MFLRGNWVTFLGTSLLLAHPLFSSSVDRASRSAEPRAVVIAESALDEGRYREAVRLFEAAAKRAPDDVTVLDGLGRSYTRMAAGSFAPSHLTAKARRALIRAARLEPHNVAVLSDLLTVSLDNGYGCAVDLDEANLIVTRLETLDPGKGLSARAELSATQKYARSPEQIVRCGFHPGHRQRPAGTDIALLTR